VIKICSEQDAHAPSITQTTRVFEPPCNYHWQKQTCTEIALSLFFCAWLPHHDSLLSSHMNGDMQTKPCLPLIINNLCQTGWSPTSLRIHGYPGFRPYLSYLPRKTFETRSVAARFGRHGMPLPASNNTGTAFCFPN